VAEKENQVVVNEQKMVTPLKDEPELQKNSEINLHSEEITEKEAEETEKANTTKLTVDTKPIIDKEDPNSSEKSDNKRKNTRKKNNRKSEPAERKSEESTNFLKIKIKRDDNRYEHHTLEQLEGGELAFPPNRNLDEAQLAIPMRKVN